MQALELGLKFLTFTFALQRTLSRTDLKTSQPMFNLLNSLVMYVRIEHNY